jgi:mannuronan synthase
MDAARQDVAMKDQMQQPLSLGNSATDHPILSLPFTAEINGRHCLGTGISLVRAQVAGLLDPALNGQERLVRLSFAFQGFTVTLSVGCRIDIIGGTGGGAVLVFGDPTGDHLPQLRHLLNGWIAGDLVSLGQTLGVTTAQPNGGSSGTASGHARSGSGLGARLFGTTVMLALSAGLAAVTLTLIYARGYQVTLPVAARIVTEGQVLHALAAGQIEYLNPMATEGEVAFTLRAEGGQVLAVAMPCACVATVEGLLPGATVQAGDPIMTVHPENAPMTARVSVPAERMFDLAAAEGATLTLADGRRIAARPVLPLPTPAAREGDTVSVTFIAETETLGPELSGALAEVTLTKRVPFLLEPARALFRALGG